MARLFPAVSGGFIVTVGRFACHIWVGQLAVPCFGHGRAGGSIGNPARTGARANAVCYPRRHGRFWRLQIPTCRDMAELVTDYLEGDMPWHRRIPVWLHLRACDACTAYFRQMRQTIALLRGGLTQTLSESEASSILASADRPDRP